MRIAGKSHRTTKEPTDYENVPSCFSRMFLLLHSYFLLQGYIHLTRLYMLRRSEVGLEAKLSETTFLR